jgi:Zn-dependent protease
VAAYRAGDQTAYRSGRITLNPIPHLDLFGSIVLPVLLLISHSPFFIAWAKPVPVNPAFFREPRRDEMKVSLAGPLSNVLLAVGFLIIGILFHFPIPLRSGPGGFGEALFNLCYYGISINLLLAVFNLIPIFPLDGSHILAGLLPPDLEYRYRSLDRYGFLILLILIMTPVLDFLLSPAWLLQSAFLRIWLSMY